MVVLEPTGWKVWNQPHRKYRVPASVSGRGVVVREGMKGTWFTQNARRIAMDRTGLKCTRLCGASSTAGAKAATLGGCLVGRNKMRNHTELPTRTIQVQEGTYIYLLMLLALNKSTLLWVSRPLVRWRSLWLQGPLAEHLYHLDLLNPSDPRIDFHSHSIIQHLLHLCHLCRSVRSVM